MYSPFHKATCKSPVKYLSARAWLPTTGGDRQFTSRNRAFHISSADRAQPLPDWNFSTSHRWPSPPPPSQPWATPVPRKTDEFTPTTRLAPAFRTPRFRNSPDFENQPKQAANVLPTRTETQVSDAELQQLSVAVDDQHFGDVFAEEVSPNFDLENLKMGKLDEIKGWVDADYTLPDENISWDEALNIPLSPAPPMEEFPDFFAAPHHLPRKSEITPPVFNFTIESDTSSVDDTALTSNIPAMPLAADGYPLDGNTRFDWRARALGQLRRPLPPHLRPRNRHWMFAKQPRRYQPVVTKLPSDHPLSIALERYRRHFSQLLKAELQEEARLFNQRLEEWSTEKLVKAGYTLVNVRGDEVSQKHNSQGERSFIYSFVRGKGTMIDAAKFT